MLLWGALAFFFFIFRGVKISSNLSNIWPTKANHPCAGSQSSLNQFHQFDVVLLALKIIRCGLSHGPCGFHVVVLDCSQPTKTCVFGFVPCLLLFPPPILTLTAVLLPDGSISGRPAEMSRSIPSKMIIRFHTDLALFQITVEALILFAQCVFMQFLNLNPEQ